VGEEGEEDVAPAEGGEEVVGDEVVFDERGGLCKD
jgi:hypothetical protein